MKKMKMIMKEMKEEEEHMEVHQHYTQGERARGAQPRQTRGMAGAVEGVIHSSYTPMKVPQTILDRGKIRLLQTSRGTEGGGKGSARVTYTGTESGMVVLVVVVVAEISAVVVAPAALIPRFLGVKRRQRTRSTVAAD